jgi:hypothetical protein
MTETWQRRAVGITGLLALVGVTVLLLMGVGARLDRVMPDVAVSTTSEHSAFVGLSERRPTLAYVETLALLGFGVLLAAGLADQHGARNLLVHSDGAVGQRRWRARMVGAPPVLSSSSSRRGRSARVTSARSAHVRPPQHQDRPLS